MKRREYQEKFNLIPKKKIETEVQDTLYLFEEVKNLIEKQDENIQHINDVLEDTKSKVLETESIVEKSEKLKTNYVGMVIGATLGSLVVVYSPYLAIGSILLGGYIGKNCQ
jgi:hypothetical protein